LGLGLKRGSNEESIGDEQDPHPPPQRRVKSEKSKGAGTLIEHPIKSHGLKRVLSFDEQRQEDFQVQPETKSEVV